MYITSVHFYWPATKLGLDFRPKQRENPYWRLSNDYYKDMQYINQYMEQRQDEWHFTLHQN